MYVITSYQSLCILKCYFAVYTVEKKKNMRKTETVAKIETYIEHYIYCI